MNVQWYAWSVCSGPHRCWINPWHYMVHQACRLPLRRYILKTSVNCLTANEHKTYLWLHSFKVSSLCCSWDCMAQKKSTNSKMLVLELQWTTCYLLCKMQNISFYPPVSSAPTVARMLDIYIVCFSSKFVLNFHSSCTFTEGNYAEFIS